MALRNTESEFGTMKLETELLIDNIRKSNQEMLSRFDPNNCIRLFDQMGDQSSYNYVPSTVSGLWAEVNAQYGDVGFDAFQKLTMLYLINAFSSRSSEKKYSQSIIKRFDISFERICDSMKRTTFKRYSTINDKLIKDLAICRQHVFPAGGARIVETNVRPPKSLGFRGGAAQALKFVWRLKNITAGSPYYAHHTHLSELRDFNQQGFKELCLNLSDMLILNPEVRGVQCGSWLYDPALETVSPELAYMRKLQQDNGAMVMYYGKNIDGGG